MKELDIEKLLIEDSKEKARAKGGRMVSKKRPRKVLFPSDLKHVSHRATAKSFRPFLRVSIETGEIWWARPLWENRFLRRM